MKFQKDYAEFIKLLNKNNVKYCIVGAYALAFYAKPRYTKDIDIFIKPDLKNVEKIVKTLKEFGFKSLNLSKEDFTEGKIIQLGYEPLRIDILTFIDGCTFDEVWKNKKIDVYKNEKIYFIGINELIKNKKQTKRKQDIADLEILSRLKKKKGGQ